MMHAAFLAGSPRLRSASIRVRLHSNNERYKRLLATSCLIVVEACADRGSVPFVSEAQLIGSDHSYAQTWMKALSWKFDLQAL